MTKALKPANIAESFIDLCTLRVRKVGYITNHDHLITSGNLLCLFPSNHTLAVSLGTSH